MFAWGLLSVESPVDWQKTADQIIVDIAIYPELLSEIIVGFLLPEDQIKHLAGNQESAPLLS